MRAWFACRAGPVYQAEFVNFLHKKFVTFILTEPACLAAIFPSSKNWSTSKQLLVASQIDQADLVNRMDIFVDNLSSFKSCSC